MKTDNNIDRYFRENLYDFQVNPPKGTWENIEQNLSKSSRRLIIPLYLKVAAGIILLASIASILWKVTDQSEKISDTELSEKVAPVEKTVEESVADKSAILEEPEKKVAKSENLGSTIDSYQTPPIAEVTATDEEMDMIIPSDTQENETTSAGALTENETQIALAETSDESKPEAENVEFPQTEAKESINKNDLIIQQNIMVLDESSEESALRKGSRWSVGGQAGPQYSYRDVSVSPDYQGQQNYDQLEDGMLAFAGGVNVQLQAAKRFSIQSGVYYSKIGQEVSSFVYRNNDVTTNVVANEPIVDPSIGNLNISKDNRQQPQPETYSANTEIITEGPYFTEQQFEFVEIPLVLKYYIVDKKLDISINGGLWTNILVGNTAVTTGDNDYYNKEATNDVNTLNYSGSLGIGFNYPVTSNLLISLDPIFKYYLSPINNNPETEVHPYTFGIMTGINFNF